MERNVEGFDYPKIDRDKCVECHCCEQACPILNPVRKHPRRTVVYAAWALDEKVRSNSSSGGVFSLLAEEMLAAGGAVAGAAWESGPRLVHILIDSPEDLPRLRGSKYVQSDVSLLFRDIQARLKRGQRILFSGTPCQNAGLRQFLRREYDNLVLCEVLCHGAPSPGFLQEYLQWWLGDEASGVCSVEFRDRGGWGYRERICLDNGRIFDQSDRERYFIQLFMRGLTVRESCFRCRFATAERCSDILLADFWQVRLQKTDAGTVGGVSLVMPNTEIGERLWQTVAVRCYREEHALDEVLAARSNQALVRPLERPAGRECFFSDFRRLSKRNIIGKYDLSLAFFARIRRVCRRILRKLGRA